MVVTQVPRRVAVLGGQRLSSAIKRSAEPVQHPNPWVTSSQFGQKRSFSLTRTTWQLAFQIDHASSMRSPLDRCVLTGPVANFPFFSGGMTTSERIKPSNWIWKSGFQSIAPLSEVRGMPWRREMLCTIRKLAPGPAEKPHQRRLRC